MPQKRKTNFEELETEMLTGDAHETPGPQGEFATDVDRGDQDDRPRLALIDTIKALLGSLPPEALRELLGPVGQAQPQPSLVGIAPEQLQAILGSLGRTSAEAMREAYRLQRKENPNYPERSVFFPQGLYDDAGNRLPAKAKLTYPTFFLGVRLSEELMTEAEIALCNRFTESKYARDGIWKAEVVGQGAKTRLFFDVPAKSVDDRMILPPFTHILLELLEGADAVNTEKLRDKVADLEARLRELEARAAA